MNAMTRKVVLGMMVLATMCSASGAAQACGGGGGGGDKAPASDEAVK
ncbi:MAG: hypothetical protein WC352_05015 [Candidatus Omnitrophota bacterium]|jgi:hypothetical protein